MDLWHTSSCISLFKWEHWGKSNFICEKKIGRQRSWWRKKYMRISDFSMLCLCWTLHMWFLEAMSRWTSYWEIAARVNCPYGVRKDRTVPLVMQGHTCGTSEFTYQLRLVAACLLTWTFVIMVCLLTTFQRESAFCFVPSSILLLESWETSILAIVTRPWLGWCLRTAFVFKMFDIVPFFLLWKGWNIEEFGKFSS